jgi:hypothetical protein
LVVGGWQCLALPCAAWRVMRGSGFWMDAVAVAVAWWKVTVAVQSGGTKSLAPSFLQSIHLSILTPHRHGTHTHTHAHRHPHGRLHRGGPLPDAIQPGVLHAPLHLHQGELNRMEWGEREGGREGGREMAGLFSWGGGGGPSHPHFLPPFPSFPLL